MPFTFALQSQINAAVDLAYEAGPIWFVPRAEHAIKTPLAQPVEQQSGRGRGTAKQKQGNGSVRFRQGQRKNKSTWGQRHR